MVLTAYSVLSPAIGLSCHRHRRQVISANLIPASRNQDHTASPSAVNAFVSCVTRVHRIPRPTCRDDRETPLFIGHGMTAALLLFLPVRKAKNFSLPDWTTQITLKGLAFLDLSRTPDIVGQCTIGQRFGEMYPADLVRSIEVGERAGDAQHTMIAARRQPHGFGSVAQEL
jgi:hypothetical protein